MTFRNESMVDCEVCPEGFENFGTGNFECTEIQCPNDDLIREDRTIRSFYDNEYCLVNYDTRRKSKLYWHNCTEAVAKGGNIHFVFEKHNTTDEDTGEVTEEDYGYLKVFNENIDDEHEEQCLYIKNEKSLKRNPAIKMRPCKVKTRKQTEEGNEKLQWFIENHSLWYKPGDGDYCVPFEKDSVARVRKCRSMTLG